MSIEQFIPLTELLVVGREPDYIVAWRDGQPRYWRDFSASVQRLVNGLRQHPQQRWGLYFDDSYDFSIALLALLHCGKTPIVVGDNLPGTVARLAATADVLLGEFKEGGSTLTIIPHFKDIQREGPADVTEPLRPDQTLEIFTSGSTGESKSVKKYLTQLVAELDCLQRHWGDQLANAAVAATVSHQHIYGLLFKVLWPLSAGRAFISHRYQDPMALLEHASTIGSLVWIASPAHLKRLHADLPWHIAKLHLVDIFSSGGPLPEQDAHVLGSCYGKPPLEIYGSTESGGIAWRRQYQDGNPAYWQALKNVKLSQTQNGNLQVESPHLLPDEQLVMADEVCFLDDGRFSLGGRLDRIVKIEEKRLSLPEIEAVLSQSELVVEARVIPMQGRTRQLLGAAVVLSDSGRSLLRENGKLFLVRQIKAKLSDWFELVVIPRQWRFPDELPINSQGKIQQKDVEALFHDGE